MNYFFHSFESHHDNIKLAESTLLLPNAGRLTHHNNIKFAESTLPLPNAGSGSIKLASPP